MGAYSRKRTSIRKNIRKRNAMSKRKSLKKTQRKKQIRRKTSIKRGGARKLKSKKRSSRQHGGYQTAQVACANSNVNTNKSLFESSFSIDTTSANNTAPPTCNLIGVNDSGTSAYSCAN